MARDLYATYNASTGGVNYQNLPCPEWADLGERVQRAWRSIARRALELNTDTPPVEPSDWVLANVHGGGDIAQKRSTWKRYRFGSNL